MTSRDVAMLRKINFDDGGTDDRRFSRIVQAMKQLRTEPGSSSASAQVIKEVFYFVDRKWKNEIVRIYIVGTRDISTQEDFTCAFQSIRLHIENFMVSKKHKV